MSSSADAAAVLSTLTDQVRAAAAGRRALRIRAGGTKDFYGNRTTGELLDPREYSGLVAYEPAELVLTARCGTPLASIASTLDERGQMLAFEPPHFGASATVGGCIAAGLAGPRRGAFVPGAGGVRDFVLGAKLLNGRGEVLSFGGTVMKNVAGYDVSRLLAGSLGTLGVLLEVSLKVAPKPVAEESRSFELDETAALRQCAAWAGKPWPVSATAWQAGRLHVRLSGAASAVALACTAFGGERSAAADSAAFWAGIREQTQPFFRRQVPLWRMSLPATAAPLELPGEQLIEWGGALRWLASGADVASMRARAATLGGHATLFRGNPGSISAFTPLPPALARIHARLKAEFDPMGIFNPGRMYADASG
ncbi:MAG TPA: glycolate oxidase subunit GlcE [Steroidobacteraceae bacterium]|nr:glycolate oxidase subunit GlcE [Steroidobacteraceae bacterium]